MKKNAFSFPDWHWYVSGPGHSSLLLEIFPVKASKWKINKQQDPTNLAVENLRQSAVHQQPAFPTRGHTPDFKTQASFLPTTSYKQSNKNSPSEK